jgi:hypothetical protein
VNDPFDHIEDYVNGSLSEKLRHSFEEELSKNHDLQLAVDHHGKTQEVLEYLLEEDIQNTIENVKSDLATEPKTIQPDNKTRSWFSPIRIAASLLILVVASWFIYNQVNTEPQIDVFAYYEIPVNKSTRGIGDKTDLELAHEAFDRRDFKEAKKLFESILLTKESKLEVTEYLGHIS